MADDKLENNIFYQEWKVCQEGIKKFDEMILDIRKYGFSLVTILLSASGYLYHSQGIGNLTALGIYIALLILIFGLFLVDRYHEVFLRGAVERSMELEGELNLSLSRTITDFSVAAHTDTWGTSLYVLLVIANTFLIIGSVWPKLPFIIVAFILGVFSGAAIIYYHYRTRQSERGQKKQQ